ncbi:MAG: glycine--tRNA ligase subunit beta [Deltaproteobacteria bacterium CG2_30_63_29]|nr:MAG: glycine--tRNA ligase subunit beta [Deltaproteobacteria bacterium CG2_30_63_29]
MAKDLLFELGCEDLPPLQIQGALDELVGVFTKQAEGLRLKHGPIQSFATPRRLAFRVSAVAEAQEDLEETKVGPPVAAAYDKDGNPTNAALGFLRGLNLGAQDLFEVTQEKKKGKPAQYIAAKVLETGRPTVELLPELLGSLPGALHWPKAMRWGRCPQAFARPVHWLVGRFGTETIDFEFAGIRSDNKTYGHRFHDNHAVALESPSGYEAALLKLHVNVLPHERSEAILRLAREAAEEVGGHLLEDPVLLDEIVHLVEWPVAVCGTFDEEFLKLPPQVLVTSMRKHQRYFSVVDASGAPMPHFVTIANTIPRSKEVVARGNRRVLRARLKDAEFFFREDQKRSLQEWGEGLDRVTYVEGLGSLADKSQRIAAVASWLAEKLYPHSPNLAAQARAASLLAKADLVTGMVGEFPELQGYMGGRYLLAEGADPAVAAAVGEHYAPKGAQDELPQTVLGALVSIADRVDSIASLFALGRMPSGAADPFALRRAALGVIRIALERDLRFSLKELFDVAVAEVVASATQLGTASKLGEPAEVSAKALDFVLTRLRHLAATEHKLDVVDAVLAIGSKLEDLPAIQQRIEALSGIRATAEFEPIAVTFKRVANILGETPPAASIKVNVELLGDAETVLFERTAAARSLLSEELGRRGFAAALAALVSLRPPVDQFFEDVLVNDPDERVRVNRHCLLRDVLELFNSFADVRRL